MRGFDMPFEGEEGPRVRMRGVACPQDLKDAVFMTVRAELLMQLGGCSFGEAFERVRGSGISREG